MTGLRVSLFIVIVYVIFSLQADVGHACSLCFKKKKKTMEKPNVTFISKLKKILYKSYQRNANDNNVGLEQNEISKNLEEKNDEIKNECKRKNEKNEEMNLQNNELPVNRDEIQVYIEEKNFDVETQKYQELKEKVDKKEQYVRKKVQIHNLRKAYCQKIQTNFAEDLKEIREKIEKIQSNNLKLLFTKQKKFTNVKRSNSKDDEKMEDYSTSSSIHETDNK